MGMAINKAKTIDGELEQIAVWDGQRGAATAGTAADVAAWKARGLASTVIPCQPRRSGRRGSSRRRRAAKRSPRRIVAMLFGDIKGFSGLHEEQLPQFVHAVLAPLAKVIRRYKKNLLLKNTWGDGLFLVFDSPGAGAKCALDLQRAMASINFRSAGLPQMLLRIGGHMGPAFQIKDPILGCLNFEGSHVTRAARIEPITPPGGVFITEPFAAALNLADVRGVGTNYAGLLKMAKEYGVERMYLLKGRPG
jgi:class 3 adenylate cyclase